MLSRWSARGGDRARCAGSGYDLRDPFDERPSTARSGARTTACCRSRAAPRCRVRQTCPARSTTSPCRVAWCVPVRSSAERCQPTRGRKKLRAGPGLPGPYGTRRSSRCYGHARARSCPGPGDPDRMALAASGRRDEGPGSAAGDEPATLRGGDCGPRAQSSWRSGGARDSCESPSGCSTDRGLSRVRLPQAHSAAYGLLATSPPGCASTTRRSPLRLPSTSQRWASTRQIAGARGQRRDRGAAARRRRGGGGLGGGALYGKWGGPLPPLPPGGGGGGGVGGGGGWRAACRRGGAPRGTTSPFAWAWLRARCARGGRAR